LGTLEDTENRATICRVTCGWKKAALPLDVVRRYWRDVHSPAIARRAGIWDYRHYQFDPVRSDLVGPLAGVDLDCPANEQLMWTSDVRYADEAGLEAFGRSPDGEPKAQLLADIDLIVDRSTTYRVVGDHGRTFVDATGIAMPQGPVRAPTYALFLRQRGEEGAFRAVLRALAVAWAAAEGVQRLRLSLFEAPDMEAERKAGYPVKTHPPAQQYQAWIDLTVQEEAVLRRLVQNAARVAGAAAGASGIAGALGALHVYPVRVVYTSVYAGAPTLVGLRGYPAWEALEGLGAANARHPALLEWMYGPVARGARTGEQR
jgi:hypothetical protein